MRVIISGGGTGGHIFPAIAIANELKNTMPEVEILFVGAKGKIEMEKVPKAGYSIKGLWISGFHRKLTLRNLLFPIKLVVSIWKSFWILKSFKPDVVIGVGGFASGPVLFVANKLGLPTLIQEQNSFAGVTNKLLAKQVNTICVAYEGMEKVFPKDKIVLTGNPLRETIFQKVERDEAFEHFGLNPSKKTILIIGGSLGARSLNRSMVANKALLETSDVQVFWQAGKLYLEDFGKEAVAQLPNVTIKDFIDRMDYAYAMADVIIARAGAGTISELCGIGKPVILIPSPNVAEDHQSYNAKALVEKDAAVMIKDKAVNTMIQTAIDLLNDKTKLEELSVNIKKMAKKNAAKEIVNEVKKMIYGK